MWNISSYSTISINAVIIFFFNDTATTEIYTSLACALHNNIQMFSYS